MSNHNPGKQIAVIPCSNGKEFHEAFTVTEKKDRNQGLKNSLVETLGRTVTAKLGILCSKPQVLYDNILSPLLDGGGLWSVTHSKSFHLLVTKTLGQEQVGMEWLVRELKIAQDKL